MAASMTAAAPGVDAGRLDAGDASPTSCPLLSSLLFTACWPPGAGVALLPELDPPSAAASADDVAAASAVSSG